MVIVDHRVAEIVVLVAELQNRHAHGGAFLKAEALRETAGCLVADDDFERNDADLAHDGVAVGKLFYKVGLDAVLFKQLEHEVGHTVVDNAFADDGALLEAVERGRVIFIGNDAIIRVLRLRKLSLLCPHRVIRSSA